MARIIVLGAGLGGISAAYDIKAAVGAGHQVRLVGDGPYFNFTPSNPWVAVGWREPAKIRVEVREPLQKQGIEFTAVPAYSILPAENRLQLADGQVLEYDYLVITTGPRLAFDEVPGCGPEGGFTQSVCTGPHAETAWTAYQAFLENPGPVVVGAAESDSG